MIIFKQGVSFDPTKLNWKAFTAMCVAANAAYNEQGRDAVITSVMDGKHMKGSKHYSGEAIDLRIWVLSESQVPSVVQRLEDILGESFDVVLEDTHIHVEYDPK